MEADGNMGEGERNKKTRQVWRGALLSACLLACGLSVNAFVPESVSLKGEGNKVDVQMSPVEKDTVSLQLSMEVQVTKGASAASVSFEFDQGLAGSVKEYRYQEETGVLTIYVSGDGNKSFPEGEDFRLGNVVLNSESGEATEATVRVKTDSLRIVNRGYDMQVRKEIYAPGEEKAVAGSDQKQPEPENPDSEPDVVPKPEDPPGEDESQDKTEGGGKKPGTHTSSGDSSDAPASESVVIPERESRPNVGIKIGAGQKKPGTQNPSDPLIPKPEDVPKEQETEKVEQPDDLPDTEDTEVPEEIQEKEEEEKVEDLTFWGIVVALGAGAFVILLMILEFRRQEEKRKIKKKKVKK